MIIIVTLSPLDVKFEIINGQFLAKRMVSNDSWSCLSNTQIHHFVLNPLSFNTLRLSNIWIFRKFVYSAFSYYSIIESKQLCLLSQKENLMLAKKLKLSVATWFFKNWKNVTGSVLYFSIHRNQRDDDLRTKTNCKSGWTRTAKFQSVEWKFRKELLHLKKRGKAESEGG